MKKIPKRGYFFIMFISGLIFLNIEVIIRALAGGVVGIIPNISYLSLMGYTSLWMILIGGLCGLLLGVLQENNLFRKMPMILKALIGAIFITFIELFAGVLFNNILNLNLWDYSHFKFNILGQISLIASVIWFLLAPMAYWFDDQVRHYFFNNEPSYSLLSTYKNFIILK